MINLLIKNIYRKSYMIYIKKKKYIYIYIMNKLCLLVFSEFESDPCFTNVKIGPILQVFINSIRVEA